MNHEIIITKDGSTSLFLPALNETYHSRFGAIQEAEHVFIKNGLETYVNKYNANQINVLEIGFGTGLNALMTICAAESLTISVNYVAIEAFPVPSELLKQLNYPSLLEMNNQLENFTKLHAVSWEQKHKISSSFELTKYQMLFQDIDFQNTFDVIYFDAFGFDVQPELWTETLFEKMFKALKSNGILVTYACRTVIKKNMLAVGFEVEKLPGAPGKREMLRAFKI